MWNEKEFLFLFLNSTPSPSRIFFVHQIFFFLMLEIAWNAKKTWNFEEKKSPPPPIEIQNQNKGIEDIMDIDSNCPLDIIYYLEKSPPI